MINISNITKKQHYIPQMILKHHYVDYEDVQIPEKYPYLWQFDKDKNIERKIYDVSEICYEKYLYEFRDDKGKIIQGTANYIEHILSKFELQWNLSLKNIIKNYNNVHAISENDIASILLLVTIQFLRTPKIIDFNTRYIQKLCYDMPENECSQYAKYISLIFKNTNDEKTWMISQLFKLMLTKDIVIGHTNKTFLISESHPVLAFSIETLFPTNNFVFQDDKLDHTKFSFYFPFDKNYCILINPQSAPGNINIHCYNFSDSFVQLLNRNTFESESRFFYAGERISAIIY